MRSVAALILVYGALGGCWSGPAPVTLDRDAAAIFPAPAQAPDAAPPTGPAGSAQTGH